MLEFIAGIGVTIAQDVMKDVLSDLIINRRKKKVSETDLDKITTALVEQQAHFLKQQARYNAELHRQVHDRALEEVHHLITAHPGLVWERKKLALAPGVAEQARQESFAQQVEGLQRLITERRRELGLPLTEQEANRLADGHEDTGSTSLDSAPGSHPADRPDPDGERDPEGASSRTIGPGPTGDVSVTGPESSGPEDIAPGGPAVETPAPARPVLRSVAPPELPSYWRQRAEQTRRQLAEWRSGEQPPPEE